MAIIHVRDQEPRLHHHAAIDTSRGIEDGTCLRLPFRNGIVLNLVVYGLIIMSQRNQTHGYAVWTRWTLLDLRTMCLRLDVKLRYEIIDV